MNFLALLSSLLAVLRVVRGSFVVKLSHTLLFCSSAFLAMRMREIFEDQQEITTVTVIWARQLVSPQPKLGPVP